MRAGHARDRAAGGRPATARTAGCARWSPSSSSCGRSSRTRSGSCARAALRARSSSCAPRCPSPTPSGRCSSTTRSTVASGRARARHRPAQRAAASPGMSRATRVGGLVVRSGRAAHESTFASLEGAPGTRPLRRGRCDALEDLQRDALERPRPQVVVKVDRSGLNENHPVVRALYAALDGVLRPIVAAEERRARRAPRARRAARCARATRSACGRSTTRSRAHSTRRARPASRPAARRRPGRRSSRRAPTARRRSAPGAAGEPAAATAAPLRFRQSLLRLHPGERRASRCSSTRSGSRRERRSMSWSTRRSGSPLGRHRARARAAAAGRASRRTALPCSADPGSRLSVLAEAGGHVAELVALVVRHRAAAGCARSRARTRTPRSRRTSTRRAAP